MENVICHVFWKRIKCDIIFFYRISKKGKVKVTCNTNFLIVRDLIWGWKGESDVPQPTKFGVIKIQFLQEFFCQLTLGLIKMDAYNIYKSFHLTSKEPVKKLALKMKMSILSLYAKHSGVTTQTEFPT